MDHPPRVVLDTAKKQYYFEQGPVKFQVDRDLCKTLGAGSHIGDGMMDKINDTVFRRWAELNGLPVDPFNRDLLRPVMMGILQNAFYQDVEGSVPESCITNQQKRVREVLLKFEDYKKTAADRAERLRENQNAHRFQSKGPIYYRPTPALQSNLSGKTSPYKGQQALVAGWFQSHRKGKEWPAVDVEKITADLVADGFTCNQDPIRAIYYYLNEWKKKGLLEVVGEQQTLSAAEPPAAEKLKCEKPSNKKSKKGTVKKTSSAKKR